MTAENVVTPESSADKTVIEGLMRRVNHLSAENHDLRLALEQMRNRQPADLEKSLERSQELAQGYKRERDQARAQMEALREEYRGVLIALFEAAREYR